MRKLEGIYEKCNSFLIDDNEKILDINQRLMEGSGDTVLHYYCGWGNDLEAIQILLENGADPNALGEDGMTPVFSAIRGGNPHIVKSLINAGANLKHKDDLFGYTPLESAELSMECIDLKEKANLEKIIKLLKEKDGENNEPT